MAMAALEITIFPQAFEFIEVVASVLSDLVVHVVVKVTLDHGGVVLIVIDKIN